ncbi:MAG: PVC-type heme-binding CxxCH protein, partial [Limisphaerales bacterium]
MNHASEPGLAGITVPEGFMVSEAVAPGLIAYPMFAAFDHQGRLYVAESSGKDIRGAAMAENPECRIRLLEDTNGDGVFDSSTVFAGKIGIPMGVLHHRGSVYVASPPDFLKLTDSNNDGVADQREVLLSGWNVRGTASLHGPFLGPDGWMYLTDGRHGYDIQTKEGAQVKGLASRIWKCRPDGTGLDWHAGGGFDNPVEVIFTDSGQMIGTMTYFTNPMHGQRDALMHFIRGGVYSKDHASVSEFKRTGDLLGPLTRFARVAPAGLHRYRGSQLGDGFRGNLFSAHFNPHRVMRHVLTRTNGTFISEDSDFLVSKHPDFHPTDIVEDADGSLIVVDTGGWYVDQCPLSRISKPEFRGSLYRVSRIGALPVKDPRGFDLRIGNVSAAVKLLQDPRPVVRDRACDLLARSGGRSVAALSGLRTESPVVEVRCSAVWILHQIGTRPALVAIQEALDDPHPEVRIAAAKSIGLTGGTASFERLHAMLKDEDAGVRRQVAATLGQLGNVRSNGPLIKAANTVTNRFEEHAIIYSLIENFSRMTNSNIKHSAKQFERLPPGSARAALIAFDQMEGSELTEEHVLPMLDYPDAKVQATASWILTRHKDW